MYNVALVRQLCANLAAEQDPDKVTELADLLQAVVKENHEEIRFRLAFLVRKYADLIELSKTTD